VMSTQQTSVGSTMISTKGLRRSFKTRKGEVEAVAVLIVISVLTAARAFSKTIA
jgi:hypothetical protein